MQARPPDGLADFADDSNSSKVESASPTRSGVYKSNPFESRFSLLSETFSITLNKYCNAVLGPLSLTTLLTQFRADHRQPAFADHRSEATGWSRPPGEAVRREGLAEPGAATQRNVARNGPRIPAAGRTRPTSRKWGLAPKPEGRAYRPTEGRPSPCVAVLSRCCSRWSA